MFEIIIINREKLTWYKTITSISNVWDCWGEKEPRDGESVAGGSLKISLTHSLSLSLSLCLPYGISLCDFGGMKVVGNWLLAEG